MNRTRNRYRISMPPMWKHTAITFEYDVPSLEEMKGRIQRTLEKYPYIVAESREEGDGGEILDMPTPVLSWEELPITGLQN